ncbi:MAG: helix-hairpin-helix domain-containing protein [Myxococcota bacterium]
MTMECLFKTVALGVLGAVLTTLGTPAWAADNAVTTTPRVEAPASDEGGVVNINTASAEELSFLPGVGMRKAEAIVARREKKKFTRPEELMEVKGIGRGIFRKCKAHVRVSGPTTLTQKLRGTSRKT